MTWTRNQDGDWIARIPGSPIPVVLQRVWGGWQGWRGTTRSVTSQSIAHVLHDLASMARSERIADHLRALPLPPLPPEVIVSGRGDEWWAELSRVRDGVPCVQRSAFGCSSRHAVTRLANCDPVASVRVAIDALPPISDWSRWRVLTADIGTLPVHWVAELEEVK